MTSSAPGRSVMTERELMDLPQPKADHTIAYGRAPQQFGELRLPKKPGRFPVVIVIHGGCWRAQWGIDHIRSLCAALTAEGMANWSLEYRRIGDPEGGWPSTFQDVARGADHLRVLATRYPLDLNHVVAVGHSAGGHLALWLAGRPRLPEGSALRAPDPLPLQGVVSLAGITDLRSGLDNQLCDGAIVELIGRPTGEHSDRLGQTSPIEMLPLGVPQRLICGALDRIVPLEQAKTYREVAVERGDTVAIEILPEVGHFELVNPASRAWPAVVGAVRSLIGTRGMVPTGTDQKE